MLRSSFGILCFLHSLGAQDAEIIGEISDGTPPPAPVRAEPSLPPFIVESTIVHDLGDHQVIVQRVQPPVLPGPPAPGQAAPAPGQLDALIALTSGQRRFLNFSATSYDHQLTKLSWQVGGEPFEAWSNIDWNLIGGFSRFEADGIEWHLHYLLDNLEGAEADRWLQREDPAEFPSPAPQFILTEGDPATPGAAATLTAFQAIHRIVAERHAELEAARAGRQARAAALRAEREANPPQLEDVLIQMWPGEGSRYAPQAPAQP